MEIELELKLENPVTVAAALVAGVAIGFFLGARAGGLGVEEVVRPWRRLTGKRPR